MYIQRLHSWPEAYHEARELQKQLKSRVCIEPLRGPVRRIAGADVSYSRRSKWGFGAVVILTFPELEVVESAAAEMEVTFPYIPGLLTFREAPVLLKAFERLQHVPDVVIFDGQGIAHPQGMGLATHMGLWLGLPAIGCAKSRLVGEFEPPGPERGAFSILRHHGVPVGAVLRTRTGVKPVFISPGHLISIEESLSIVLQAASRYRLPEPVRLAHLYVNESRRHREG